MRTHIFFTLIVLTLSACASKRDIASTEDSERNYDRFQHAQMIDGAASRIR